MPGPSPELAIHAQEAQRNSLVNAFGDRGGDLGMVATAVNDAHVAMRDHQSMEVPGQLARLLFRGRARWSQPLKPIANESAQCLGP